MAWQYGEDSPPRTFEDLLRVLHDIDDERTLDCNVYVRELKIDMEPSADIRIEYSDHTTLDGGWDYFLELFLIKEIWDARYPGAVSDYRPLIRDLVYYAINDDFPD